MISNFSYRQISDSGDKVDTENGEEDRGADLGFRWQAGSKAVIIIATTTLAILLGAICGYFFAFWSLAVGQIQSSCSDPVLRREWRELSKKERHQYLSAVDCLYHIPSKIRPDTTVYEDFSWTHNLHSNFTHHTASFLPWHRYYLQVYLDGLRTHCGYTGDLVYAWSFILTAFYIKPRLTGPSYWDWSLDFENPPASPIFDADHGFGGDGTYNEPENVSNGTCVRNGPFAYYRALYVNSDYAPHCLSRKFAEKLFPQDLSQSPYQSEAVEELLASPNFEDFANAMYQMHDDMHDGIGGDLQYNTSPYDPLFYVHHTQLDRLWWLWQQQDPQSRVSDYGGDNGEYAVNRVASLNDLMMMEPIAGSLMISSVMDTKTELLCYRY